MDNNVEDDDYLMKVVNGNIGEERLISESKQEKNLPAILDEKREYLSLYCQNHMEEGDKLRYDNLAVLLSEVEAISGVPMNDFPDYITQICKMKF